MSWSNVKNDKLAEIVQEFSSLLANKPAPPSEYNPVPNAVEGGDPADLKSLLKSTGKGQDHVVKAKLFEMLTDSKREVDRKYDVTEKVHNYLKNNYAYKLGFMVGHLKTRQDLLTASFEEVRKNLYEWDNLKILDAYEQMRKTERHLDDLVATLKAAAARPAPLPLGGHMQLKTDGGKRIAWDYYDES